MQFTPQGIIPALVTPLNDGFEVDEFRLIQLLDYLLSNEIPGVFLIGSTGEAYGLDFAGKRKVIETTVRHVKGKIDIYAGTGGVTTKETIALTQMAQSCGVDAVSLITPYFINPSQKELIQHYTAVAKETNVPILLYNNIGRTKVAISADTACELAKIDNIIGIKDSSGDMTLTGEYIRRTKEENFSVLVGRDTLILAGLCYGATGAIAACANIAPRLCVELYRQFKLGNMEKALELQYSLAPLRMAFSLGSFPVVIKEALKLIGLDMGACLAPIQELDPENRNVLRRILQDLALI